MTPMRRRTLRDDDDEEEEEEVAVRAIELNAAGLQERRAKVKCKWDVFAFF